MTGAGEEVGGGNHSVGAEPFAAGGVVGEVAGVDGLVERGVFKGHAANDDVHRDVQIHDLRVHLQVGLEELGTVREGVQNADIRRGLRTEGKFVHLLLREDGAGRTAQAGLQDRRAGLQRLEIEPHAAGGGLFDADLQQRGIVGGEEHGGGGSVDEDLFLATIPDLTGDGALEVHLRHGDDEAGEGDAVERGSRGERPRPVEENGEG